MTGRRDDPADIEAKLRQIADYQAKGLMRAEEADAQRAHLQRRLLDAILPDAPRPRPGARMRLGALGAMAGVVAAVAAWLLWGNAGLQPRTVEMLRIAARPVGGSASGAPSSTASGASGASAPAGDPHAWVSGTIEVPALLARRLKGDEAVFITIRHPGETGLPLAAVRKRADDLPLAFSLGPDEGVGDTARVTGAPLVVQVLVSKSGRALPQPGDLDSETPPVPVGSTGVRVVVTHVR